MPRRLILLAATGLLFLVMVVPATASAAETVRDEFNAIAFDGDDGTASWEDSWREIPIGDGPTAGQIRVVSDGHCAASNCLRLGDETLVAGIYREANLSEFTTAKLTYTFRREMTGTGSGGSVKVRVSDDLWSWVDVASHAMSGSDPAQRTQTVDLTDWVGGPVKIAFFGVGQLDAFMYIDDVEIVMSSNVAPSFDVPLADRDDTEGDTVTITPEASDPDPDELSFSAVGLPPGIAIDSASGVISGTISFSAAASSPYTTVVTVSDGVGGADTESFRWTITDRNRAPSLASIADVTVGESSLMQVVASASDPDLPADSLTFSLTVSPPGATVNGSGHIRWTPSETAGPGTHDFAVKVADSGDPPLSAVESFEVTVAEVNTPPVLSFISDQANGLGDTVSLSVEANDGDVPVNTLTFTATGLPPGVSIGRTTGFITGTIPSDAVQSNNTITVTVKDNGSPRMQANRTFTWQVTQGNHAPVLAPVPDQRPNTSGVVSFDVDATDVDAGDKLNYWLADGIDPVPAGAVIDAETGSFSWTPSEAQHDATYRINVGVSDSGSPRLSDTQLVTITVPKLNEPPQITNPGKQRSAEGETVSVAVDATDPDGDGLRYRATGLPAGLAISAFTGEITGEVGYEAGELSPYTVTVEVIDSGLPAKSATTSFEWSVDETNRPPIAEDLTLLAVVGEPLALTLVAEDPDGDDLEFSITTEPIAGTLSGEPPELSYLTPGGADLDSFIFTVSDGEFETAAEVKITVRSGNAPPHADPDEYETSAGEPLVVAAPGVLGNDSDVDAEQLVVSVVSQPAHGVLVLDADGSFTYTPDDGFAGGDKFIYAATDAFGESATATVVLNVIAPPAPVVPLVDDGPKLNVVVASTALWQPSAAEQRPLLAQVRRSVVAAVHAGITTLPEMRFPLLLLAIALLLGLTIGRISTLPFGGGKREELGLVQSYDELHQIGRLTPERGAGDVFVSGRVIEGTDGITVGDRVRYVAADMHGRRIALRVWPAGE